MFPNLTDWVTLGGRTGAAGVAANIARRASAMSGVGRKHTKLEKGDDLTHARPTARKSHALQCVTQGKLSIKGTLSTPRPQRTYGGVARQRSAECL